MGKVHKELVKLGSEVMDARCWDKRAKVFSRQWSRVTCRKCLAKKKGKGK